MAGIYPKLENEYQDNEDDDVLTEEDPVQPYRRSRVFYSNASGEEFMTQMKDQQDSFLQSMNSTIEKLTS